MAKTKKAKKTRDEQFIEDLYGYMIFCAQEGISAGERLANIAHDLSGWHKERKEAWWSPRTTGYGKKFLT